MCDKNNFWPAKRVFITGNTGFKGSWLSIWLHLLKAKVYGYALKPPTEPNLFNFCSIDSISETTINDIRDRNSLETTLMSVQPEIVFHLAAQPIVRQSYKNPVETYEINVLGTVYLLEAIRKCPSVRAVVIVTTDKCYENKEWFWAYRENEPMGGYDPYSSSKGCAELVTNAYRQSYFNPKEFQCHHVALASVRAGNVIGGGDWAEDRLIPDSIKSILSGEKINIRNPDAIRPWQHVLEPLSGYLLLAEKLFKQGSQFSEAWNFGPNETDCYPVKKVVEMICRYWGENASCEVSTTSGPHEAHFLKLDCSKARALLNWNPKWNISAAIENVVEWYKGYERKENLFELCISQINKYENSLLSNTKEL